MKKRQTESDYPEQTIAVHGEYVTLGQLLKVAGIIGSGGEAKFYLSETVVIVNGVPEQRRGRKLRPGDIINATGSPTIRLIAPTSVSQP